MAQRTAALNGVSLFIFPPLQSVGVTPLLAKLHHVLWLAFGGGLLLCIFTDAARAHENAVDLAHQYARKAVALDPSLPDAHAVLGFVLVWMRQHDASIAEFERAVVLNPNYMDWRFGWALVLAGNPQRAIGVLEAYMRLDPFHAPVASCFVGYAYFMLGDYSWALRVLQDFVFRVPLAAFGHAWLAAAHAQLGQLD